MIWRIGALALVGSVAAVTGTWLADRDPPTTLHEIAVLTPQVRPGGDLKLRYKVVRRKSCATTIERILFDSQRGRFPLEDLQFNTAPGPLGPDQYTSNIPVPRSFSHGEGRYRAITTYRCNPIHGLWPVVTGTADVTFDVLGEPVAGNEAPIEIIPRR